ncbi:MAG: ATPase, partial [Rubrivivax sp.]|nr:ATPase [Pyrinomonadaceae bacterium]
MSKLRMAFFAVIGVLASAAPVLAQAGGVAADNASSVDKYKAIAAGLGFALAAALAGIGQS